MNRSGITFGQGSQLNVGGLVASTLDITNSDFLSSNFHFLKTPNLTNFSIQNSGTIHSGNGGAYLIADHVENNGTITTTDGSIALVAGDDVTLNVSTDGLINVVLTDTQSESNKSIKNAGILKANDGSVYLLAQAGVDPLAEAVNHSGIIEAK